MDKKLFSNKNAEIVISSNTRAPSIRSMKLNVNKLILFLVILYI